MISSASEVGAPDPKKFFEFVFDYSTSSTMDTTSFKFVEASIEDYHQALASGSLTSVELIVSHNESAISKTGSTHMDMI